MKKPSAGVDGSPEKTSGLMLKVVVVKVVLISRIDLGRDRG
jgi:hypothetical protein